MRLLAGISLSVLLLPLSAQTQWTDWKTDPTFPGIEVRTRCDGFNEFARRTMWDVQLRNAYTRPVDVAWEAEPALLHGPDAQADHAAGLRPGETIEGHVTAPKDCSSGLMVRVDDVRGGSAPSSGPVAAAPPAPGFAAPAIQGTWRSKDPEPYQKQLQVQIAGHVVSGAFTSPGFSFQFTTPIPEKLLNSVSVGAGPVDTAPAGPDPVGPPLRTR
jgi:hypothetical protein